MSYIEFRHDAVLAMRAMPGAPGQDPRSRPSIGKPGPDAGLAILYITIAGMSIVRRVLGKLSVGKTRARLKQQPGVRPRNDVRNAVRICPRPNCDQTPPPAAVFGLLVSTRFDSVPGYEAIRASKLAPCLSATGGYPSSQSMLANAVNVAQQ